AADRLRVLERAGGGVRLDAVELVLPGQAEGGAGQDRGHDERADRERDRDPGPEPESGDEAGTAHSGSGRQRLRRRARRWPERPGAEGAMSGRKASLGSRRRSRRAGADVSIGTTISGLELVAEPPDRHDVARVGGVGLDLGAQPADVDVDQAAVAEVA